MLSDAKTIHLLAFHKEVLALIDHAGEQAGVNAVRFFGRFPSMRDAMWTIAHFSYGQGKSAVQGATDWFTECVVPHLARMGVQS